MDAAAMAGVWGSQARTDSRAGGSAGRGSWLGGAASAAAAAAAAAGSSSMEQLGARMGLAQQGSQLEQSLRAWTGARASRAARPPSCCSRLMGGRNAGCSMQHAACRTMLGAARHERRPCTGPGAADARQQRRRHQQRAAAAAAGQHRSVDLPEPAARRCTRVLPCHRLTHSHTRTNTRALTSPAPALPLLALPPQAPP